jgi:hypothetical protein
MKQLGIPKEFAPRIESVVAWYGGGRNDVKERRAELRKMAVTQIAAIEEKAKTAIATDSVNTQQKIVGAGITSEAARELIEAFTPIENMMPRLEARVIERCYHTSFSTVSLSFAQTQIAYLAVLRGDSMKSMILAKTVSDIGGVDSAHRGLPNRAADAAARIARRAATRIRSSLVMQFDGEMFHHTSCSYRCRHKQCKE